MAGREIKEANWMLANIMKIAGQELEAREKTFTNPETNN